MDKLGKFSLSTLGISKISVSTIIALVALMSIMLSVSSVHAAGGAASITTDQSDYLAGSTVTIYGTGFATTPSITVNVTDPNNVVTSWLVGSDSSGSFVTTYALDHVNGNYGVIAYDNFGNSASTTFHDASEAANLDQCQNGGVGATPVPCVINNSFKDWVNGNVNGQKAHWREGEFLSYRVTITGLTAGTHSLVFTYDTVHSGNNALDYLGSFDNTETTSATSTPLHANNNNPCVDQLPVSQCTPSAPTSSLVMTNPTLVDCDGASGTPPVLGPATFFPTREFKAWGPSGLVLTSMSYVSQNVLGGTGQCTTTVQVNFSLSSISAGSTIVIAWGGHIACACDWGVGHSASAISGSPYHMALSTLDGASTGSQDRALATSAVFFAPSITTTIKDSAGNPVTSVTSGTVVHDTATLTGASPTAGGTVNYERFNNIACSGTPVVTQSVAVTNGIVPNSNSFTTSTGQFSYEAVYSGDSANLPATSGCEPLSVGSNVPSITTSVSPATITLSTTPTPVTDTATVTNDDSAPGSITFTVFNTLGCSGSPVFTSTPVAVTGNGVYTSPPFTPTAAGTYYWVAAYTNSTNASSPATTACGASGETLVVNPTAPPGSSITTSVSPPSIIVGSSASDTATLSGTVSATGSITFQVFTSCSGGLGVGTPIFTSVIPVSGNGNYNSGSFTFNATGTYFWVATYSGDANNNGIASPCGDPSETVSVGNMIKSDVCATATAGKPFTCTATVTGGTAPFTFTWTLPSGCTGSSTTNTITVTCAAKGSYTISDTVVDSVGNHASAFAIVTVTAQPLVVTVTCPGSGVTAGKPFSCNVSATGGTSPYTGTGSISVTQPVKGTFTQTFTVTDANGRSASGSASVTVSAQPLVVTVTCPSSGLTAGKPFNCTVSATGGTQPYTGTGTFSVTEQTKGSKTETFQVSDANHVTASGSTIVSVAAQPLVVTVSCSSGATAGKPFSCTVSATGGTTPYTGTGTFSRTEATKGSKTETFSVTDANGVTASGSVMVTVGPQPLIVTVTCDSGTTAGKPFSCTVSATGGTSPYSGTGTFQVTEPVKGHKTESFSVTDSNAVSASGFAIVDVTPQPIIVTVSCASGVTAGKPFNCTVSFTGGTAPYTGTGTFSRTEPTKGTKTESFTVMDANGVSAVGSATVTVAPQPLVVTVSCDTGATAGKPFSCSVTATGGTTPYTGTGTFSIIEPTKGVKTESFTVTDANGASASGSTSVNVAPQPLIVTVSCGSGQTAGKPFNCSVSATGGTSPYSGTGSFSVTQPVKGSFDEQFTVTDANGAIASGSASVTVTPQPVVVTVNCGTGQTAGKPFNCTVSATGGTGPYAGTGTFSVTQPVKGTFTERFSVTDANQVTASGSASVTVAPQPLIVTVTCDSGATAGKPFGCTVSATGGTGPYNGVGTFSVTQPVKGTFTETFSVTDANGVTAIGSASVTVAPQPLVVTVTCDTGATAGKPFNCSVSATGGTSPYAGTGAFSVTEPVKGSFKESFTVTDGNSVSASGSARVSVAPQPLVVTVTCPSGLTAGKPFTCSYSATGGTAPYTSTGTSFVAPSKGPYTVPIFVTDSNGITSLGTATVTIAPQPLVVTVTCDSGATAGKPFNCDVSATGGTTPYSGTGSFSLTEPVKGTFTESFSVTDANGITASGSASVTVVPQPLVVTVTCESVGHDTAGKPFPCTVSATGGTTPYSGTGTFQVTQPVKGTFTESFSVTDANGVTASGSAIVTVTPQPLIVTVNCGTGQTAGKPFSCDVSATGGTAPYQGTGSFQVTEPVKGTFEESFTVKDANGATASGSASVTVAPQPLVVTVSCGAGATAGKPFSCAVDATGGTQPYSGTGTFTITEPVKGTFTESFTVTDSNGISASGSTTVIVAPQPLVVTVTCGSANAAITAGKPFSCIVSATGGTEPYSGTGTFTLTEAVKGGFTETFSVTDANGVTATGSTSINVVPQPLVVTVTCGSTAAAITAGKPFSCIVSATGGTTPYSGTGTFTLTEAVKGGYTETFSVTDANGVTATGSASINVVPQPLVVIVDCGAPGSVTAGKPFGCHVLATGGTTPYSGTGTFTVTEPVKGTFVESFSVTDANGVTASGSTSVTVAPQPLVVTVTCGSANASITAGKPFECTISATGGTEPYSGTGTFSLTEQVKGGYTLTFSVTDANSVTATGSASVTVAPQPLIVTVSCVARATAGKPFSCTVDATGGTQPYSGTGTFTVTEPVKGSFTESFSVTDANGVTASGTTSVPVAPQPLVVTVICDIPGSDTAGKPFQCHVSATGGTQPYSGTGDFSVTEQVKGTYVESFSVTDANGVTASGSDTVVVAPQPLIVTVECGSGAPAITAGKPFNCIVSATGGTQPYSGTGTFALTEQVKGAFTETFSVTDANGVIAKGSASVNVAPQPLVVTVSCDTGATAGKPFNCTVDATGGTQPYSGTGIFTVTEPVKGSYTESFSVTDANGVTASGSASVSVAPQPLVVTVICPSGLTAGKPFACSYSATGGTAPYTSSGTRFVAPVKGLYTVPIFVTDSNGVTALGTVTVNIAPQPFVVTVDCGSGATAGKPFDCTVSATGGTTPYNGIGGFTVTEPVKGTFSESFKVTDANGASAIGSASVTVAPQPLVVTVTCDTGATAGKPFNCDVSATGGTAPYLGTGSFIITEPVKGTFTESFTVTDSNGISASGSTTVIVTPQPLVVTVTCPSGLTAGKPFACSYSATGGTAPYTSSGTRFVAPVKGPYVVPIFVTDSNGVTALGTITVNIAPQPLVVTVTCDSNVTAGKPFNCDVSATGGTSPYFGTGSFSITESVKGTYTESFTVKDSNGVSASGSTTVIVTPQPLVVTVTCGSAGNPITAGKPFDCTVSATGGTQPYSGTGTFTLTEQVKGGYTETFSVTDANGVTATSSSSINVVPQPLVVTVQCLVPGSDTAGKPFNCIVSATGGTQPYTGTGTFHITERVKGTYTETFSVTDANGITATGSDTVYVAPQPLIVTVGCASQTAAITAGKPFSCTVSATGGTQPYSGTGTFTVTEAVKGGYTESFSVTDANGITATGSANVNVVPQPLVVTVVCNPTGADVTAGKPFNCMVSATGGTAPYSGTGSFTVTEQVKGSFTETFSVIDANGVTASGSASVTVAPQPLVVTVSCATGTTAGKPFNCDVSATGGTSPYSGTGSFTLTEHVKGTFTESFTVTDANGVSASGSASVSVAPQPLVVTVTCPSGLTAGKPFTCSYSATGGTAPYTSTGTSFDSPTKGKYTVPIFVTDSNGVTALGTITVNIAPQPLVVTVTCDSNVTAGKPFNCDVSATGGTTPYSGTGSFSVTEPVKGSFTESFSVTDSNQVTASGSTSVTVAPQPLVVTVSCEAGATAGKPFSCTVSAAGGTGPYSGTGSFTVTEPVKGTFTESFTVTDANGVSASGSASVIVAPQPLVVTVSCPSGLTAGKPFTCTYSATGGTAPYTSTGTSFIAPSKGLYTVPIFVTDSNGVTALGTVTVNIAPQPLVVTVTCDSGATAGKPFECTVSASGGTTPYSGTGAFSVTEPVKATFTESFTVKDANGATASGSASVTVAPQPLVVTVTCDSGATAGKPFNCTVSATGGTAPYSGTGSFSITQSVKGTFTESFTVSDANGATASASVSVVVTPQPLVITVDCGTGQTAGKPFDCSVSATGGTGPYTGTGSITVTEPVKGLFTESFRVTDANGATATGSASVSVAPQPLVVTVNCGSGQTAGKPFSCTVSATGGTAPYTGAGTFSVTEQVKGVFAETFTLRDANGVSASGSANVNVTPQPLVVTVDCGTGQTAGKPFSCTVSATGGTSPYTGTGTFTVTQLVKGTFTESFTVTDANGASASSSTSVTVTAQPLVVTVTCPSSGLTAGKSFSCTVSATGGTTPYTGTGTFTVTQSVKGTFTERFTVNDANGASASASTTVTITAQPLVVTVTCPTSGLTAGKPFSCTVSATGGTGPYTGTGSFSVTQPVKGTFTESFTVHDANGATASGSATVTVSAQPLIVSVTCQSGSTAGKPFTCTVSANGGTAPYAGTGTFTVVKQTKGTYSISYTVTDTNGVSAQGSATVTVQPQPLAANFTSVCSGAATVFTATVSGGTTPYSFNWNFGDSSTGTGNPVSHTYGTSGTFTVTLTVTDANGARTTVTKSASGCGQPVVVTDTSFCTLPNNNFVLIFITDPQNPSSYRLVSSNPGQFYDNVFYSAAPGSPVTLNIQVPYPFITNGAYPIQVSTGLSLTSQGCFVPNFANPSGFTITAPGPLSPSGHPTIVLSNYSPQNFGSTVTVTVTGTVPSTGLVYVTIHLDYGLKGTTGWLKGVAQGSSFQATNSGLGLSLNNGQSYAFSVSGSESFTTSVTSSNVFKKDPGIAGVVLSATTGNPIAGATVKVYDNNGNLVGITTTDQNGVYLYFYKYTGSKVNYTVKVMLPSGAIQTTTVTMQSNKLVEQDFLF